MEVTDSKGVKWILRTAGGAPVAVGDFLLDFRGDAHILRGGTPPRHSASEGHIETSETQHCYASVCGLKWGKA